MPGRSWIMNAGASLYIGGKAETMADGVKLAAELIDSGKALETLNKLIEVSNRPEPAAEMEVETAAEPAAETEAVSEMGVQG